MRVFTKKEILFRILTILLFSIGVYSCRENNPDLTGKWECQDCSGETLIITKSGDNYVIIYNGPGGGDTYSGKYDNGTIKIGQSFIGDISYNNDNQKIYFMGIEFSRMK